MYKIIVDIYYGQLTDVSLSSLHVSGGYLLLNCHVRVWAQKKGQARGGFSGFSPY